MAPKIFNGKAPAVEERLFGSRTDLSIERRNPFLTLKNTRMALLALKQPRVPRTCEEIKIYFLT